MKHCIKPFQGIWYGLTEQGQTTVKPCCMYPTAQRYTDANQWLQSQELADLQHHMLTQDELPLTCKCCRWDEDLGLPSMRLKHLKDKTIHLSTKITELEIMPSNSCNLSCISCNPSISTGVGNEWKKVGWLQSIPVADQSEQALRTISELPDLSMVSLIGGEFFVTKNNLKILDVIVQKKLGLRVITNGVSITPLHLQKLQQIKDLDITVSTDGVGTVFEFLRYPGKWSEVQQNIIKLKEALPTAKIHLNALHHPLSCQHLMPIFEFANSVRLPITVICAHRPLWLTWLIVTDKECAAMAQNIKNQYTHRRFTKAQKEIIESTISMLETWNRFEPERRQEFVRAVGTLVKHRGIDRGTVDTVFGALTELADEVWHHLSDSNARPPSS